MWMPASGHAVTSTCGIVLSLGFMLSACSSPARYGMVKDPNTGLQFGSVVERNIVTDPSFHQNRKLKVRIRNTSGDAAFNLAGFQREIEAAYAAAGYDPTSGHDFGLLIDINVMYSGQVQTNLATEFGFLGAAGGGLAGAARGGVISTAAGTVAGATLGSIAGSYVSEDTYIIVTRVTVGTVQGPAARDGRRIVFSRSVGNPEDEEERLERERRRGFRDTASTAIAVYAGGRNATQDAIAGQVRERIVRIIRGII